MGELQPQSSRIFRPQEIPLKTQSVGEKSFQNLTTFTFQFVGAGTSPFD